MRELSEDFKAHLAGGVTTLCQCWLIERRDGTRQGFTDHDEALSFDGIVYQPQSGFISSEAVSSLGLGVDTGEIDGALQSDAISEAALHAGDYDNAQATVFVVNWQSVDQRITLRVADIGEITCEDGIFRAELRGLIHKLNQTQGRLFENACDADLGDGRCRVNLDNPAFSGSGQVVDILDGQTFLMLGLATYPTAWFDRGLLTWTGGGNTGRSIEIDNQVRNGDNQQVRIWLPMPQPVEPGDSFTIVAGCDKLFATCREKFSNIENFRGFPHIPGNDFAFRFARSNGRNDGGSLVS